MKVKKTTANKKKTYLFTKANYSFQASTAAAQNKEH